MIRQSISSHFSCIKPNENAPAEAAKTEASKAVLIPVVHVMDKAKINSNNPLSFANKDVLKPISNKTAKIISAIVARMEMAGINPSGAHGFSIATYFSKLFQFPQAA